MDHAKDLRVQARPVRLLLLLVGSIFVSELFVMWALHKLPSMAAPHEAVTDAFMLTLLLFPAVYLLVFRPMVREIREKAATAGELQRLQASLETQVAERTRQWEEEAGERQRAEQRLARLGAAVEQSAEAIVVTDTTPVIQYVNPAFEQITGYSFDEAVGRDPGFIKSGHQDEAFYADLRNTITSGKVWHGRFQNLRKDGRTYCEDCTISPVFDEAGVVTNFVAVKRDMTEHVSLQTQLQQAQKMEAVGRLAGGVAHDFNNLLMVILGNSELLQSVPDVSAEVVEMADAILEAGRHATGLTHQLLAFSRQQLLEPRVLNLNSVLCDLTRMIRRLIGEDVEVATRLDPDLGNAQVDAAQLTQVVLNLALNARDAMPDGGTLTLATCNIAEDDPPIGRYTELTPNRYVSLSVSDTGEGMDTETLSRVFEPFFTTKELGKGTGLGLATVYGIIKQSGGFIFAESEAGAGTTFHIFLPRTDAKVEESQATADIQEWCGTETILLVEDDRRVRDTVSKFLRAKGYTVQTARSPGDALLLAELAGDQLDLVLTDMVLPQMSGRVLADRLKRQNPRLPVLYMSGYLDEAATGRGGLDLEDHFIRKPFSKKELGKKVRSVLEAGGAASATGWEGRH